LRTSRGVKGDRGEKHRIVRKKWGGGLRWKEGDNTCWKKGGSSMIGKPLCCARGEGMRLKERDANWKKGRCEKVASCFRRAMRKGHAIGRERGYEARSRFRNHKKELLDRGNRFLPRTSNSKGGGLGRKRIIVGRRRGIPRKSTGRAQGRLTPEEGRVF